MREFTIKKIKPGIQKRPDQFYSVVGIITCLFLAASIGFLIYQEDLSAFQPSPKPQATPIIVDQTPTPAPKDILAPPIVSSGSGIPITKTSAQITPQISPPVSPKAKPTDSAQGTMQQEAIQPPPNLPERFQIPSYMRRYEASFSASIKQGTVSFTVKADWTQDTGDKILLLANFNGQDQKNLFKVTGSRNWLAFDSYDQEGLEDQSDAPNGDLGGDYFGQTYKVKLTWNYTVEPKVKRVYINGQLKREAYPENVPTAINPDIYLANIEDLLISNTWEAE